MSTTEVIGQAIYTWTRTGNGFGFAATSPAARNRLGLLETLSEAKFYPGFDDVGVVRPSVERLTLVSRRVVGDEAFLFLKTFQGEDALKRPGRYCNQIFIASPKSLPASAVALVGGAAVISPRDRRLANFEAPRITDLNPREIFDRALRVNESDLGVLIDRLDRNDWTSITLAQAELVALPALMESLGERWDRGSSIDVVIRDGEPHWRLTLRPYGAPNPSSTEMARSPRSLVRGSLAAAQTSDDLARIWKQRDAISQLPTGRHVFAEELSDITDAVSDFSSGNTSRLTELLADEGTSPISFADIAGLLIAGRRRLPGSRLPELIQISIEILRAAAATGGVREIAAILPPSADDAARVARGSFNADVLLAIASLNSKRRSGEMVKIDDPTIVENLWPTLMHEWDGERGLGLRRTLQASGAGPNGIVQSMMPAARDDAVVKFAFERVLPDVFAPREAYQILTGHKEAFLVWSGLPEFYWEAIRRGPGWLEQIRAIAGRKPGGHS